MRFEIINKFKIPTTLGLGLIVAGIASGIFLVVKDQVFFTKASSDLTPKNITISNIQDTEIAISWQTSAPTTSFITYGLQTGQQNSILDDMDTNTPGARSLHYVTIKNLQPASSYLFKIISGKFTSEVKNFKTAKVASLQNGFGPIIGTVFDGDNPLKEGTAYLSISDAIIQSARLKDLGNFLIPISLMRKVDLSDTFQPKEDDIVKVIIISDKNRAIILFKIKAQGTELPPVRLGQSVDLTSAEFPSTSPPSTQEVDKFDLNGDKQINVIDYSEVLQNFGKNPKNEQNSASYKKSDLNGDGVVDRNDLELIAKKVWGEIK